LYVWRQKFGDFESFEKRFERRKKVLDVEHIALHRPKFFDQIFDEFFDVKSFPRAAVIDNVECGQVLLATSHPVDLKD
jgi:hypothetical protein